MGDVRADLSWAAYVAEQPARLPRGDDPADETWASVPSGEYRRVTRNWRRWRARRRLRGHRGES